jgi:aspartyl-tRNA(Asn)/glutamyl-tRNA(Gln) amidotransferase subunit C
MISQELVQKTAHLARLTLTAEESVAMADNLTAVLSWMDKLSELDTTSVEPLIHISAETNVLRADVAEPSLAHDKALINAPDADSSYFRVPRVIEEA